MTTVKETVSLNASSTDIWSVIGGFESVDSWHPAIAACDTVLEGEASIRHLTLADGSKIVERLDSHDDEAKTYVYTILDAAKVVKRSNFFRKKISTSKLSNILNFPLVQKN